MTGKSTLRVFFVYLIVALFAGLAGSSAFAALTQVYLDVNGNGAGDGTPGASGNPTYFWATANVTGGTATVWNTSATAGNTTAPVAWVNGNPDFANFGGFPGDASGWALTMAISGGVGNLAGVNVGLVAPGSVTWVSTGASTLNLTLSANQTWTVAAGSSLIDTVLSTSGDVNLNGKVLTLAGTNGGAGNITFSGSGLMHGSSTVQDNFPGIVTINAPAILNAGANSFDSSSKFNLTAGTLALAHPGALGCAVFTISGANTPVLSNAYSTAMTLTSTGAVNINTNFVFSGTNDLAFGSGTVALGTTPTITVQSNTLTFPTAITGASRGINMVGPGTMVLSAGGAGNTFGSGGGAVSVTSGGSLVLNGANSYTGGTNVGSAVSSGTVAMNVNGALGNGPVNIQSGGGLLLVGSNVTSQLGNGNVTIQPGGLLDTTAFGAAGGTMNGGVLTAGRGTASVPATDINGNLRMNTSTINVVGGGNVGTITVNGGLSLTGNTLNYYIGDLISLTGSLTLGGNVGINPQTSLVAGTYPLFSNNAGLTGGTANLQLIGNYGTSPRTPSYFAYGGNGSEIDLVVTGAPAILQWTGSLSNVWDTQGTQNWWNTGGGSVDVFYGGDNVIFSDSASASPTGGTVSISGTVQPGSVTFSNSALNYVLTGPGSIGGGASVQLNGPGTVTINTSNTCSTTVNGGLLNIGNSGALGTSLTITGGSIDNTTGLPLTLANGITQNWNGSFNFVGSKPLNMGAGSVALNASPALVTVNAGTLGVGGAITGVGALELGGSGLLLLTASSNFTGGSTVDSGTLQLGTGVAGQDGVLGSAITNNGALVYNIAGNAAGAYSISGTGSLTKIGTGTQVFSQASTGFTGTTSVNAGILEFNVGGGNGTFLNSPIIVGSAGTLQLNANDSLGFNPNNSATTPITIYGMMVKTNAQSETVVRPITLSGGTMNATAATTGANAQDGSWDFFSPGPGITTAPATANFIMGSGTAEVFSIRNANAYFSLGLGSTLTISVPIMQNHNTGSSPNCNITGPGLMIFSGTNMYGSGGTAASAAAIQVGYAIPILSGTTTIGFTPTAGNLELVGSGTFPRTADGSFQVAYGSTLTIVNGATAYIDSDLKLGAGSAASSGTANQTGGALAVLGSDAANGNRSLVIGEFPGETSVYNLSGGSLNVPNGLTYLGYHGSGALNMSGGTATLLGISIAAPDGLGGGTLSLSNGLLSIGSSGIVSNNAANTTATLSGGTLAAYGSWSTTVPISVAAPIPINLQGNTVTLGGALSGTGSLNLNGPGTLALGASNGYSGGTTVGSGVLVRVGASNALGSGMLVVSSGSVSSSGQSAYTLPNPLVLSGGIGLGDTTNYGALTFTAAGGTLAQNITLAVNSPVTINGNLTDSGSGYSLTKNGTGSLTLAGNNTYSGTTVVNNGKLYINGTNATNGIYVAPGMTLGGSGTAASAAVNIDSSGGPTFIDLSQNGGATFTTGSLTFQNFGTINLPTISSTATLAMKTGAVTTNAFGPVVNFSFPPKVVLNPGSYRLLAYSSISDDTAFTVSSQPVLGSHESGGLQDTGTELDFVITGYSAYWNGQQPDWRTTGAWTHNPDGSTASFASGDIDFFDDSGSTGSVGTNVTINHGNVNPVCAVFNNAATAYVISGSNGISGPAFLQVNGPGSVTISTSNSYSGGTVFNAGTLNLNNASAIGSGTLAIGGGTLGNTSGGPITLSTTNAQGWNADFTFAGPYNLNLGTGAVTLAGNRTLTLAAGTLTVAGAIAGTGDSLTVTGPGGLVLGGANTYNGGTFLLGGNVTATNNGLLLGSGAVTMSPASGSATLNLTGTGPTINGLSSSGAGTSAIVLGNVAVTAATTLTVNNVSSAAFGGNISDLSQTAAAAVGSLVVNSTGTTTLSGSNTYTGSTTVGNGTLKLGSSTALYAGPAIGNAIVNGTFDLGGYNANVAGLSGTGTVMSSGTGAMFTAGNNNATSTFGGTIAASLQSLTKTGTGILTLTATNTVTNINISQGTLQVGSGGLTGSLAASATVANNGALVYNYGALTTLVVAVPTPVTLTGTGAYSVTTGGTGNALGMQINGSLTTGGYQYYNETMTTHARGTGIEIGPNSATPSGSFSLATTGAGSSITMIGDVGQNHATTTGAQDLYLDTSAVNGTINLNISIGYAGGWFNLNTFTANAGTGAINWVGTTVNGVNNYQYADNNTGPGNGNQTTPITLTGAINFASNFYCYGSLTMTLNPTAPSTLSGVLRNRAAQPLTVNIGGPSILTVTSANTYTGPTSINGGTMQLGTGIPGQDGSIANTSGVTDNAALVYDIAGSQTAGYAISGAGSLSMSGSGTVYLSGANSYSSGTNINAGVLQFTNINAMSSSGTVTVASGAMLAVNAGGPNQEFSNGTSGPGSIGGLVAGIGGQGAPITWASGAILGIDTTNAPGALIYQGAITDSANGPLNLTKRGAGNLTLAGVNTYSGSTTISGGTLQLGTGTPGQDGSIDMTSGVTDNSALVYDVAGSPTVAYGISGSGSLTMLGTGTLTLAGTNTYIGGTTVANGTLIATSVAALADGSSLTVGSASAFPAAIVPSPVVVGQSAVSPVPEPGTLALLAFGLGSAVIAYRRRGRFYRR